jgi:hypothetical protein
MNRIVIDVDSDSEEVLNIQNRFTNAKWFMYMIHLDCNSGIARRDRLKYIEYFISRSSKDWIGVGYIADGRVYISFSDPTDLERIKAAHSHGLI